MKCVKTFGIALACLIGLAAVSEAVPVGVDGLRGAEWIGISGQQVGFDPAAPVNNFGTPGNTNHVVAYTTYLRSDNEFLYALVEAASPTPGLVFANLYFDLNYPSGSDFGIEVSNNRAFIPGVSGYTDLTAPDYYSAVGGASVVEMAISLQFLQTDPLGMGFTRLAVGAPVRLNLSQSFGYSVAGGQQNYGDARLGLTQTRAAAAVPEPASMALFGAALAYIGARRARKRA